VTGIRAAAGLAAIFLVTAPAAAQPAVRAAAAIDRAADPQAAVSAWRGALAGLTGVARGRALAELAAALAAAQQSGDALAPIAEAKPLLARAAPVDRARLYSAEAIALADLNKLKEADAAADLALAEWARATPRGSNEQGEATMTKATIAFARGDLATAKRIGAEAVAIHAKVGGPATAARIGTLSNMSTITLQARELEDSERYAREAVTLSSASLPEDHPVALIALNNWVAVLAAQNKREESVDILGKIARIREKKYGPDYPPLAITYNNLSRNLMFLERSPQAEPFARKAVAIAEKTRAADDQGLATMRDNLADILVEQGKLEEASALRRKALADLGHGNENRAMRIRRSLATGLVKQGEFAAALSEYETVGEWLGRTRPPDNPDVIESDGARAVLEARLGKPGANRRLHDTLDRIERSLFSGGDASRRLTSLGPTLLQLLEAAWRTSDRAAGFRVAQLSTWGDAGRAVAAATARESSGPNAALIRKRQDLLAERDRQTEASLRAFGKNVGDYRAATAEVARIDGELAAIERDLARTMPAFAALARFTPATEAEVAVRLAPEQALVVVTPAMDDGAVTFVVRRSGGGWAMSPPGRNLTKEVAALREGLAEGGTYDPAKAHALYRALVPVALDKSLARADTWLIASGGAFSAVPFAALVTDAPKPGVRPAYLIRKVALATVPGVTDLNAAVARSGGDRFVGIGAPVLSGTAPVRSLRGLARGGATRTAALAQLAPLPAAGRELQRMGAALGDARQTLLLGAQATEASVKAGDYRDASVLAFATHGLIGGAVEPGSEPGLVLTPPTKPDAKDDGLLTASEIAQLDLPVEWVVLSACDTAAGASPGAPALSGLARAFLYAGARSLLVSHWAVRDDVAARLTVDTVRRTKAGDSRPQALRKAMLALIDDPRVPGGRDPSVWAPFILVQR
jgi:CHAT domain-containing protein/tetratricopeptide (TPR) repeat protein